MQKLVVDTNVVVSALISKSYPAQIIKDILLGGLAQLILTEAIWSEYVEVLHRDKFTRFADFRRNADLVLLRLDELAFRVTPTQRITMLSDADDDQFLEAAVAGQADYLITGNTNDFTLSIIQTTRIVTPAEYWQNYRPV